MRLLSTIASPVAASLLFFVGTAAGDCGSGPFGDAKPASGKVEGQFNFCDTRWEDGHVITGIEVWSTKHEVTGIQFSFSDGTKGELRGNVRGDRQKSLFWDPGQTVKKLNMFDNKRRNAFGGIDMEVDGKPPLETGSERSHKDGSGDSINVYSGFLLVGHGIVGDKVSALQLKFMDAPLEVAEVTSMDLEDSLEQYNDKKKNIENIDIEKVAILNTNEAENKSWTFQNTVTQNDETTDTREITHMFGVAITVSAEFKVGVPLFGSADITTGLETSYGYQNMKSVGTTESHGKEMSWSESGTVSPGRAVLCKAISQRGVYDSKYTSIVRLRMKNDKTYDLKQPGHFKSTGWGDAQSNCRDVPLSEVPGGADWDKKEAGGPGQKTNPVAVSKVQKPVENKNSKNPNSASPTKTAKDTKPKPSSTQTPKLGRTKMFTA